MTIIKENEGIKLIKDKSKYYLDYDAGAHMIKRKRIKISSGEAKACQYADEEMYNTILNYQNRGIYGTDAE
ncbi:MAG: hypothetical protein HFH68_15770 [Lachnospiraceae bacterium]|nr:hypothetical protein [Lachnospiraceae bacterium]